MVKKELDLIVLDAETRKISGVNYYSSLVVVATRKCLKPRF